MIFAACEADRFEDTISFFAKFCACQMVCAVNQGQLDILARRGAWQQVKILKDESDLAIPDISELISIQTGDVRGVQNIMACRRSIETTQDIHERGFSGTARTHQRSEEHTSELQSRPHLVCRLLLEKKKSTCMSSLSPQQRATPKT